MPYRLRMGAFLLFESDQERMTTLRLVLAERFGIYRGRHREPRRPSPADLKNIIEGKRS